MRSNCQLILLTAILSVASVTAAPPSRSNTTLLQTAPPAPAPLINSTQRVAPFAWLDSYNEARETGQRTERLVMLFVTMNGCHYCDKLHSESFADPDLAKKIKDEFVPTRLYLDRESKLAQNLKITLFPTTIFIAPDGKIVGYVRGYVPRDDFQSKIEDAVAARNEQIRLAQAAKTAER